MMSKTQTVVLPMPTTQCTISLILRIRRKELSDVRIRHILYRVRRAAAEIVEQRCRRQLVSVQGMLLAIDGKDNVLVRIFGEDRTGYHN